MTIKKVERLDVYIWNQLVGSVAMDSQLDFYAFAYAKQFAKSGIELSPLHMPLNNTETPFVFTDLPRATYRLLPSMLADALPDDFGNALIDRYMVSNGISSAAVTALDRLAYMGSHSMGALEFKPNYDPRNHTPTILELNNLVTQARSVIVGSMENDESANAALRSIIEVGTSAGGARAKAVIAYNPKTKEIRSGRSSIPENFEHWLLKFDGMGIDKELGISQDYGRIEYAYYIMAKAAGIYMSDCGLLEENGRAHFMTKRFDRENTKKHHVQTLCAINHLDYKKKATNSYEQLFITMKQLNLEYNAMVQAFRRLAFNVLAFNCDDHTKNISFILRQGQDWDLAPAYDLTFAHNPDGEWTYQHLMSVNGKFKDIASADLLTAADRFGIGNAKQILNEVTQAIDSWPTFATQAGVKPETIAKITAVLKT